MLVFLHSRVSPDVSVSFSYPGWYEQTATLLFHSNNYLALQRILDFLKRTIFFAFVSTQSLISSKPFSSIAEKAERLTSDTSIFYIFLQPPTNFFACMSMHPPLPTDTPIFTCSRQQTSIITCTRQHIHASANKHLYISM